MSVAAVGVDVTMPQLSDSMEEGTIIAGRDEDGDVAAAARGEYRASR